MSTAEAIVWLIFGGIMLACAIVGWFAHKFIKRGMPPD